MGVLSEDLLTWVKAVQEWDKITEKLRESGEYIVGYYTYVERQRVEQAEKDFLKTLRKVLAEADDG